MLRDDLVHKLSEDDFDLVIATHLKGTFLCAQAAQREMVPRGGGAMVFLSSGSARGNRGQANYSAAKAGIEGLTRTLAIELGRFGIRVNAVAPGFIETRMTREIAERTGVDYDEVKAARAAQLALGRVGRPEEIASAIAFLGGRRLVVHDRPGPHRPRSAVTEERRVLARFAMAVERGKIHEFARATGATNPAYFSEHPPVPPTFLISAAHWRPPGTPPPYEAIGMDLRRVLHGEQEFRFHGPPVRAPATLTVEVRLESLTAKEGRRGGLMRVAQIVSEFSDEDGRVVAEAISTTLETGPAE